MFRPVYRGGITAEIFSSQSQQENTRCNRAATLLPRCAVQWEEVPAPALLRPEGKKRVVTALGEAVRGGQAQSPLPAVGREAMQQAAQGPWQREDRPTASPAISTSRTVITRQFWVWEE